MVSRAQAEKQRAMDEHMSYLEVIWERKSGRAPLREIPSFLRSPTCDRLGRTS